MTTGLPLDGRWTGRTMMVLVPGTIISIMAVVDEGAGHKSEEHIFENSGTGLKCDLESFKQIIKKWNSGLS